MGMDDVLLSQESNWFHGSVKRGLKPGDVLLPQTRSGYKGWAPRAATLYDPGEDDRANFVFIAPSLIQALLYSIGPNANGGGLYRVYPLGEIAPDIECSDNQFTCEKAKVVEDLSETLLTWDELFSDIVPVNKRIITLKSSMETNLRKSGYSGPSLSAPPLTISQIQALLISRMAGSEATQ